MAILYKCFRDLKNIIIEVRRESRLLKHVGLLGTIVMAVTYGLLSCVLGSWFHSSIDTVSLNLWKKELARTRGPLGDNLRCLSQNESGSRPLYGNSVPSSSIRACVVLLHFCIKVFICKSHVLRKYLDFFSTEKNVVCCSLCLWQLHSHF